MNKRARIAVAAVIALLVAYGAASVVVMNIAITPKRTDCHEPSVDGVAATAIDFASDDDEKIPLKGWLMSPAEPSDRAVVMIHGLEGCGWGGSHKEIAKEYLKKGFTVVVFDLRAQGRSGGEHLGLGWKERADVSGAVKLLESKGFKPGKIGLHGTSFGAGTALLSAAMIPDVGAVVADSAFADVRDLMNNELDRKVHAGFLFAPGVRIAARVVYGIDLAEIPPEAAVPKIAPRPIFFLHGMEDERIPVEHARRLKAASLGPSDELWLLPGAQHTQGLKLFHDEFLARTTGFLAAHL